MDPWLKDESRLLSEHEALAETHRTFGFDKATEAAINIAVFDVTIHDVKRWFGKSDIRIDALVTTPTTAEDQVFHADTFVFPEVRDGETLPIERKAGLGLYTGWPQYLLDVALIASVGGPDQKPLVELMANGADQLGELLKNVTILTSAAPHAAAIAGAGAAAAKLSGLVLQMLADETGKSVGLYRATWYENRHRFGIGLHPSDGERFREKDFEFRYEIFQDRVSEPSG